MLRGHAVWNTQLIPKSSKSLRQIMLLHCKNLPRLDSLFYCFQHIMHCHATFPYFAPRGRVDSLRGWRHGLVEFIAQSPKVGADEAPAQQGGRTKYVLLAVADGETAANGSVAPERTGLPRGFKTIQNKKRFPVDRRKPFLLAEIASWVV